MFSDSHIHSNVSFDGNFAYDDFIKKGKELSLDSLTFTEHYDIYDGMDPHDKNARPFDINEYKNKFSLAKSVYSNYIKMGVEIGLRPDSAEKIAEISRLFDYDFIMIV